MESDENLGRPLFGVSITPTVNDVDKAFELAKIADDSGIDLVTIQGHLYINHFLGTWTLLTAPAMRTRRVRFMSNVADIPLRRPPILAK